MSKSIGNGGFNSSSYNPFFDDEDDEKEVDDFTFLNSPRQGSSGYMLGGQQSSDWNQHHQQLLDERKRIEERTLQSSNSTLRTLIETEEIGVATAEELIRQGEKLKNIEYGVDDVNSTLRTSQKHITSMKSIFGGIKSYFSRSTTEPSVRSPPSSKDTDQSGSYSKLREVVNTSREESSSSSAKDSFTHPALRLRGQDTSGFSEILDDEPQTKLSPDDSYSGFSRQVDQRLDKNLDDISLGISRIKNLAIGLGDEITDQNEMLTRLTGKMERTEDTLGHQNREISRILKR